MKAILTSMIIIAMIYSSVSSCAKDKVQPMAADITDTISFSEKILPLMLTNCATSGCHDPGTAADGRVLSDYNGISQNADAALGAMKGAGFQQMPLGADPLADSLINQFQAWISQGKLNN